MSTFVKKPSSTQPRITRIIPERAASQQRVTPTSAYTFVFAHRTANPSQHLSVWHGAGAFRKKAGLEMAHAPHRSDGGGLAIIFTSKNPASDIARLQQTEDRTARLTSAIKLVQSRQATNLLAVYERISDPHESIAFRTKLIKILARYVPEEHPVYHLSTALDGSADDEFSDLILDRLVNWNAAEGLLLRLCFGNEPDATKRRLYESTLHKIFEHLGLVSEKNYSGIADYLIAPLNDRDVSDRQKVLNILYALLLSKTRLAHTKMSPEQKRTTLEELAAILTRARPSKLEDLHIHSVQQLAVKAVEMYPEAAKTCPDLVAGLVEVMRQPNDAYEGDSLRVQAAKLLIELWHDMALPDIATILADPKEDEVVKNNLTAEVSRDLNRLIRLAKILIHDPYADPRYTAKLVFVVTEHVKASQDPIAARMWSIILNDYKVPVGSFGWGATPKPDDYS